MPTGGPGHAGTSRAAGRADPTRVHYRPAAAVISARLLDLPAAEYTDDASLVEHIGGQVQVVDGDPLAFKITTKLDLLLAQAIVRG